MQLNITINLDNAAFEEYKASEIRLCLLQVIHKIYDGNNESKLKDSNGNTIGQFSITEEGKQMEIKRSITVEQHTVYVVGQDHKLTYEVVQVINSTDPTIGIHLTHDNINTYIAQGFKVIIRRRSK